MHFSDIALETVPHENKTHTAENNREPRVCPPVYKPICDSREPRFKRKSPCPPTQKAICDFTKKPPDCIKFIQTKPTPDCTEPLPIPDTPTFKLFKQQPKRDPPKRRSSPPVKQAPIHNPVKQRPSFGLGGFSIFRGFKFPRPQIARPQIARPQIKRPVLLSSQQRKNLRVSLLLFIAAAATITVTLGFIYWWRKRKKKKENPSPKKEQPRIEQPRIEQPRIEQPRIEQPRIEQPRIEQPRIEQPKKNSVPEISYSRKPSPPKPQSWKRESYTPVPQPTRDPVRPVPPTFTTPPASSFGDSVHSHPPHKPKDYKCQDVPYFPRRNCGGDYCDRPRTTCCLPPACLTTSCGYTGFRRCVPAPGFMGGGQSATSRPHRRPLTDWRSCLSLGGPTCPPTACAPKACPPTACPPAACPPTACPPVCQTCPTCPTCESRRFCNDSTTGPMGQTYRPHARPHVQPWTSKSMRQSASPVSEFLVKW